MAKLAQPKFAARQRVTGGFSSGFADLLRTLKTLFDPYRPELHYMRGPGPKWHAKHAPAPVAEGLDHATLARAQVQ